MKIKVLPNISKLQIQVHELTPSTYSRIRSGCTFPVIVTQAFKTNNLDWHLLLPNLSKASHLGTIIHKLFEERVMGLVPDEDEYERRWEQYVKRHEDDIKNYYSSLQRVSFSDYDKMYESCDSTIGIPVVQQGSIDNIAASRQHTLEVKVSYPGYIYGTVDRIKFHPNGIEIIDYKSGKVFEEDGSIKEIIAYQMNLYAICCEHQYGKRVSKLTVIHTSNSEETDVLLKRNFFESMLIEIKSLIKGINTAIDSGLVESQQSPNEQDCPNCNCKHLCKKYLESEYRSEYIVDGIVVDNNSRKFLKLQDSCGKIFTISKMNDLEIDDWDKLLGKHLIFINVSSRIDDVYKRINSTLIYEIK
jgi:CRISPR/Cas system-associated exonuclease Cas4 (RecB family)